jgi:hypothetical protein
MCSHTFRKAFFLEEADELLTKNNIQPILASQHRPINLKKMPYSYSTKLAQARFLLAYG